MSFPSSPLDLCVQIHVGGEWDDITGHVLTEQDVTISRGRSDWASDVDPGRCSLVLDNRGGRFSPRNPRSPYYGRLTRNTPLRVGVRHGSQTLWRFHGEVTAWPARWEPSQTMQWAPIEAAGLLQRLSTASTPLQSALRRFIMASDPVAYWPLTDGERTQTAHAAVGGNLAYLNIREGDLNSPMRWASFDVAEWLEPLAQTPENTVRGLLRGFIRGPSRPENWSVDFIRAGVGGFDSMGMELAGAGTDADPANFWYVDFDPTTQQIMITRKSVGDTTSSVGAVAPPLSVPTAFDERAHMFRFEHTRANASTTRWRLYMDGQQLATGTFGIPPRPPVRWIYEWFTPDDGVATTVALGHITVWDYGTAPTPSEMMLAFHGHSHETAGARIARVAEEAGIPVEFVGDPDVTHVVGPQGLMSPLDCLREAARADGGILYESREDLSLVYRTSRSRYHRGRTLENDE